MGADKIHKEYQSLTSRRGYFSWSNRQVLEITGKDAEKFLHNLLSQHVEEQQVGERRWSTLLNAKGRLIGFFEVWKLEQKFLLIIHQAQKEQIFKTLETYWITEDLAFKWLDNVQIVSTFIPSKEVFFKGYAYETNKIAEEPLCCRVDDFFIPSMTMLVSQEQMRNVSVSAVEISHDLFESIRIQSGFPLPMVDYEDPIPIEVPFMHRAISFTKGCYVGQETIARLHARGLNVSRKLLQFSTSNSLIEPQNIVMADGAEVGKVTSIAFSPTQNQKIGMAWIHRNAFDKAVTVNGQAIEVMHVL
jgi:folate-binding protein YgfZ